LVLSPCGVACQQTSGSSNKWVDFIQSNDSQNKHKFRAGVQPIATQIYRSGIFRGLALLAMAINIGGPHAADRVQMLDLSTGTVQKAGGVRV